MRNRALLLLMAVVSVAVSARAVEWRQVGPEGGTVTVIAAATSERMLLAGTAEGLLFRSVDRAESWERVGTSLGQDQVLQIIINPNNAARMWVRTNAGIFRSSDRGNSFLRRLAGYASQFAVAPANPDVVYAAAYSAGTSTLLKSTDGGATWATPANAGLTIGPISVAVDAVDPSIVYAAGYSLVTGTGLNIPSLWRSGDGGASWQRTTVSGFLDSVVTSPTRGGVAIVTGREQIAYRTTDGVTWTPLTVRAYGPIAFDPSVTGRVYIGWGGGGFYRSDDDGTSVRTLDSALLTANNLVVDPADSNVVYAGMQSGGGVMRSDDAGQTWTTRSGHLLASEMSWMAADPSDSKVLYAGGDGALFRSPDHGMSWSAILPAAFITPPGQPGSVSSLAVDPRDSKSLWVTAIRERALWHSTDAGGSWQLVIDLERGVFAPGITSDSVVGLALDRNEPNTIWVALFGNYDAGSQGGIFKSIDGGRTFTNLSPKLGYGDFFGQLVVDPDTDPVTPGRIWIGGTHGYGKPLLLLSSDSGTTWTDLSASLTGGSVTALVVDRDHGSLYVALRGPNAIDTAPRLFRSDDAGQSWQGAGAGLTAAAVAIDPTIQITSMILQRGLLYAAFGPPYLYGDTGAVGGILVSADRGANWSDISGAIEHRAVSQLLAADPVIAATIGQGIFVQSVGGRERAMRP